MPEKRYRGQCACGHVRYEASHPPYRMVNCHCRDCQRASGSGYAALCAFHKDHIVMTGDIRYYRSTSDRGMAIDRGFCPTCGNPLTIRPQAQPDAVYVFAASLDDPALHEPTANIWTKSAQPWVHMDPNLPRLETTTPPTPPSARS
jgi:hypothetical protein